MSTKKSILDYDTVALDDENSALVIIDQTQLPYNTEILNLTKQKEIWNAIYLLQVRGAPAIGVAAAIGIYLAAKEIQSDTFEDFYEQFMKAKEYLASARPTAVNLFWALNRMENVVNENSNKTVSELKEILHKEAVAIREEDIWVWRPLLQGARLTAYELQESKMDVTLICDNMSATVMKNGWVNAVFVGCDRVAANGDTANKIGTSVVATVAKRYNVPVYICAPTSTIDLNTKTGADIHIEQRPAEEVTEMWYKERMAPEGVKVFNPCFDVTDNDLIAGIITEYGIAKAPYSESLKEIFAKKEAAKAKK
ncbi:MAG: translation initiation factor, aIF-2BI family [Lachnospiraceae bacterium]|nr:translation initiation factor, aIF-2BI family [Lachnospiraceae bacterium]